MHALEKWMDFYKISFMVSVTTNLFCLLYHMQVSHLVLRYICPLHHLLVVSYDDFLTIISHITTSLSHVHTITIYLQMLIWESLFDSQFRICFAHPIEGKPLLNTSFSNIMSDSSNCKFHKNSCHKWSCDKTPTWM